MRSYLHLLHSILKIKTGSSSALPFNYTFSVTNRCNSHCRTCSIWKSPPSDHELTLDQYEKIFKSIGHAPFWVTISGGQPTLRPDLPALIKSLITICKPHTITIPTNGILPDYEYDIIRNIVLEHPYVTFKVNISLDGTHDTHDFIRGKPANFLSAILLFNDLTLLSSEHHNLIVGYYTVISRFNYEHLPKLLDFINQVKPQSYGIEPAQYRPIEMNNDPDLLPDRFILANAIEDVIPKLKRYAKSLPSTPTFRDAYYDFLLTVLRTHKMPIRCMAGQSSIHISPSGEVWSCCTSPSSLGNLSTTDYDLAKFLRLSQPKIKALHNSGCYCMMSNAFFSSYICNFSKIIKEVIRV